MMQTEQQPQAFISYSHKNKKDLDELRTHLKYLEQLKQLTIWDDRRIQPGKKWQEVIEAALTSATVAVLLVTPDFLASDFITKKELPVLLQAAQEEKLTLLWVLVRPCTFAETPLADFQATNDQPLAFLSKAKRDLAWAEIARMITAALTKRTAKQIEHDGKEDDG